MALARIGIALVLVALFMGVGVSAIDSAYQDSGQSSDISGETLNTGAIGEREKLEQSDIDSAFYTYRPTITNGSGILMTGNGDDYTWNSQNGTFVIESSALANENGVTVDYSYTIPQQEQTQLASFYGDFFDGMVPLALFFLTVALIIGAMARLGGA